ncbi:MAG: hypothetical protein LBO74_00095 [Candidatus Symbiothrix sp.]|jgi:hypothetical protein|nr:hypothetical protein [Candidatus Symbiothrix sp.]
MNNITPNSNIPKEVVPNKDYKELVQQIGAKAPHQLSWSHYLEKQLNQ